MRGIARMHLPTRQRGAALLILLALFATAAAYMLVSSLNKGSVALSLARSEKNRQVMQEAKAALIAWAASETLQGATFQPGALPCPDRNNDGYAEGTCSSANRLGRLPYKTLGIAELRDASGELLWYAVSGRFRRLSTNAINSDTLGQLSISGLVTASNVIAVVLAPGMRLGTQDRSPDEATCTANNNSSQACNTAANYLDGINGDTITTDYVAATENLTDPVAANLFNDQLLAITQQDLMSVVEPVVAGRIQRDIVLPYIYNSDVTLTDSANQWSDVSTDRNRSRYFDAWGGFPFAAPFADPSSSSYTGVAATFEGLLPVVGNLSYIWGSGTIAKTGGSGTVSGTSCTTANAASDLICSITWTGFLTTPVIRMSGTVAGVGSSFVQLTKLSDVSVNSGSLTARTLSGSLTGAGAGVVTLDATVPTNLTFGSKTSTITINNGNLLTSPLINPSDPNAGWFNSNQWYRQTYYAVSPGYAPGGIGSCNPSSSPNCLNVYNLATPYANPTTNTRAIVILAGHSLSSSPARPNGTLSNYLEAKNASTGDYSFEHGMRKTTTDVITQAQVAINDRVIVVAP